MFFYRIFIILSFAFPIYGSENTGKNFPLDQFRDKLEKLPHVEGKKEAILEKLLLFYKNTRTNEAEKILSITITPYPTIRVFSNSGEQMGMISADIDAESCFFNYEVSAEYRKQGVGTLLVLLIDAIYLHPYKNMQVYLINTNLAVYDECIKRGASNDEAFWATPFGHHVRAIGFTINEEEGDSVRLDSELGDQWLDGEISRVTVTEYDGEEEMQEAAEGTLNSFFS